MNADELKRIFGAEYPAAVTRGDIRMPLRKERRFSRSYSAPELKMGHEVSRFHDGSAKMSYPELEREWFNWSEEDRIDFAWSCSWLSRQPDAADMVRFLLKNGDGKIWLAIALFAVSVLSHDEAFVLLSEKLPLAELGRSSNMTQAIAKTKHSQAEMVLRRHLETIQANPRVWEDIRPFNWPAYDVTCCIEHLFGLGVKPVEFEELVKKLVQHPSPQNQQSSRRRMAKYYDWVRGE